MDLPRLYLQIHFQVAASVSVFEPSKPTTDLTHAKYIGDLFEMWIYLVCFDFQHISTDWQVS